MTTTAIDKRLPIEMATKMNSEYYRKYIRELGEKDRIEREKKKENKRLTWEAYQYQQLFRNW